MVPPTHGDRRSVGGLFALTAGASTAMPLVRAGVPLKVRVLRAIPSRRSRFLEGRVIADGPATELGWQSVRLPPSVVGLSASAIQATAEAAVL